jgi:hypothetical protein
MSDPLAKVSRQPPWQPISATILFFVVGALTQNAGLAVGTTLLYLGLLLILRANKRPPDLLVRLIAPELLDEVGPPSKKSMGLGSKWTAISVMAGLLIIGLGTLILVFAWG